MKTCLPAVDGGGVVDGAEARRRGQEDHVRPGGDRLLVGVEADEDAVGGHDRPWRPYFFRRLVGATLGAVLEGVGHGDDLDVLGRSRGSSSAAPVPRPPQPIRAIFNSSPPAAWAVRAMFIPPARATPAAAAVVPFRKSRRVACCVSLIGLLLGREVGMGGGGACKGDSPIFAAIKHFRRAMPLAPRKSGQSPVLFLARLGLLVVDQLLLLVLVQVVPCGFVAPSECVTGGPRGSRRNRRR